jgi:hypothetical protein
MVALSLFVLVVHAYPQALARQADRDPSDEAAVSHVEIAGSRHLPRSHNK